MITNTNLTLIQGNLVRDAEFNDQHGLITFSIAVDYAGNEKDSESNTGYFDVKMWVRESQHSAESTVKRIKAAYTDGKLGKGAKVAVAGRLMQERWPKEGGGTNSRVVIMAEDLNVMFSGENKTPGTTTAPSTKEPQFSIDSF
jgi:single-stranded DNA-binding protein